ncbi:UPF0352 protein [Shewanella algidipiscicola]|uniref:UPF0352 protein TUM4630_23500 n=2 Tax=Shewanella algidipiscicola TaxID=614070 RepID=A0ABQ4PK40_9GAMM|nr:UPF0352 protein [Shewanella algidipiscicola]
MVEIRYYMLLFQIKVNNFLIMAIQSKYSNAQVESILAEMLAVLDKHQAPTDLSLMVLGNCVTDLLMRKVPKEARDQVAQQFANALTQSVKG